MNRPELISIMASKSKLTKKESGIALDAMTSIVTQALVDGDTVSIVGFGKFSTTNRRARDGMNPSTGAKIKIEAKTVAKFHVSNKFKKAIR